MNRLFPTLSAVLLVLYGSSAGAAEWWASSDGDTAVEGWGYLKNALMGAYFRGIDLYEDDGGGLDSTRFRLGVDTYHKDLRFTFELELASDFSFAGLRDGLPAGFGSTAARPRLWDPDPWQGSGVSLSINLDRLFFRYSAGPVDITIGRQAISWGSAWFWKPTDRFAPFSPVDIDPDVKRGVDAFRLEAYLSPTTSLDIIATFERHPDDELPVWTSAGARIRTTVNRYDLAFSLARFQSTGQGNWMIGAEFQGELPRKVGFRGEAALNVMGESREWDIEVVLGVDYTFKTKTTLAGELMFNGYGASGAGGYLQYLTGTGKGERLARGEAFNMGRYYAGLMIRQEINPLVSISFSAIANLGDPSAVFAAGVSWSADENIRLTAGVMVPAGSAPYFPAGSNAGSLPVIRSEFGLMPALAYTVLKFSY